MYIKNWQKMAKITCQYLLFKHHNAVQTTLNIFLALAGWVLVIDKVKLVYFVFRHYLSHTLLQTTNSKNLTVDLLLRLILANQIREVSPVLHSHIFALKLNLLPVLFSGTLPDLSCFSPLQNGKTTVSYLNFLKIC